MPEQDDTILYHTHPVTGEFVGSSLARLDPLEGLPVIPAHATLTPPPEAVQGHTAVFAEGVWTNVVDHRGQIFYRPDRTPVTIALGVEPEQDWTTEPAPLSGPEIISGIKREAARRIADSGHDWMALRQVTTSIPVPQNIVDYAAAVRTTSNALEQSLPSDYADDTHWPTQI